MQQQWHNEGEGTDHPFFFCVCGSSTLSYTENIRARSTYYYKSEPAANEEEQQLEDAIPDIFAAGRNKSGRGNIET